MKLLIPIQNLIIEDVVILGNVILLSNACVTIEKIEVNDILFDKSQIDEIKSIIKLCERVFEYYHGCTIAIVDSFVSEEDYVAKNKDILLLEGASEKVDRALDYIRYFECRFDLKETLPGLPGIVCGYKQGVLVDLYNIKYRAIIGNPYHFYFQPGIGLMSNIVDPKNEDPDIYELFFSDRIDEVYFNCRSAVARMNEAMYMNNINSCFIYLLATLESLVSVTFMPFTDVRVHIASFAAQTPIQYKYYSEKLFELSKKIRTDVVHFGKTLYELMSVKDSHDIIIMLNIIIVDYCNEVIQTGITNFDDLDKERQSRTNDLEILTLDLIDNI